MLYRNAELKALELFTGNHQWRSQVRLEIYQKKFLLDIKY